MITAEKAYKLNHKMTNNTSVRSVTAAVLFYSWMISFPYEGQVLYTLAAQEGMELGVWIRAAIGVLVLGLGCGVFVRSIKQSKTVMLISETICFVGSGMFFILPVSMWPVLLLSISFPAGLWTASWGWFFRACSPHNERIKTAAACLSASNVIMIGVDLAAARVSPYLGSALVILLLMACLFVTAGLPTFEPEVLRPAENVSKPFRLLCLFIIVVAVNSGLMFSVVNPAFANFSKLTIWFGPLPYIVVIVAVMLLPKTVDRSYIPYAAIAMLGMSFLAFLTLGRSVRAYIVVNTLLLGACGINDLFWWSMLSKMLDFSENPSGILGIGLSANVIGVFFGELIANLFPSGSSLPSLVGLAVVCTAILLLPPLQKQLSIRRDGVAFLPSRETDVPLSVASAVEMPYPADKLETSTDGFSEKVDVLSARESQIVCLLFQGYTRKLIADELMISENTVKTHIASIYDKFGVNNKTELIKKLKD